MRTRLTAAVALLVLLSLTAAGAIVYALGLERLEEQTAAEIDQEFEEFRQLREGGVDPSTGAELATVPELLDTFLRQNVPDDNELLLSWYAGGLQKFLPRSDEQLAASPPLEEAVRPLVDDSGSTTLHLPPWGELRVDVQAVRPATGRGIGALVVVTRLDQTRAGLHQTMRTYAAVSALLWLLVTAAAGWLSGRLLAPLRTLRVTADEITETDLSRRLPVTGNDDITALTHTVNGMLDRLQTAFVEQRQFLDDAGHELRTPLTVLRGHLELLEVGSPAEVAETRDLLLDEVDRMARLVGDLILLAKSNRPDFVTRSPTDLAALTHDLLAKARALGDREWVLDGADEAVVRVDEQRITQAVLQLADNAVKHTGVGDMVAIGSARHADRVEVWVRDSGPGVPEADRRLVFERFGRSSVASGDEGFGLGLSIVRAIATAHGGDVRVEDAVPSAATPGARFVVTLRPPEPPAADPPRPRTHHPSAHQPQEEDPWPGS